MNISTQQHRSRGTSNSSSARFHVSIEDESTLFNDAASKVSAKRIQEGLPVAKNKCDTPSIRNGKTDPQQISETEG